MTSTPLCNMTLRTEKDVSYLTFPCYDELPFVRHSFSTKLGGVSEGVFATMNLSFHRGDPEEKVLENYHRICDAVGYDFEKLVASAQDHHTVVRRVTSAQAGIGIWKERDLQSVDGLITNVPGVVLVTYYADCTPLYFVDPVKKAIGLSHAGWRGTVAEMGKHTVKAMTEAFGTDPKDLIAAIGPSIGQCCYEVDGPVIEAVRKLTYVPEAAVLQPKANGRCQLDLWELNRRILLESGIPAEQIHVGGVCTRCHSDLLYSHRVMGAQRGGMAAMLSIREPGEPS
ncbi:MAG: peptidoglycan editing factor PgeF [Oscillospiraceae bacterium]|nr:peptidoglycan editing factor PgeF [Oscillospiraceae bacterium]